MVGGDLGGQDTVQIPYPRNGDVVASFANGWAMRPKQLVIRTSSILTGSRRRCGNVWIRFRLAKSLHCKRIARIFVTSGKTCAYCYCPALIKPLNFLDSRS